MDESEEGNSNSKNGGQMKGILKKYSRKRKTKPTNSNKEWAGPSHKRFGYYLSQSETTSLSDDGSGNEADTDPSPAMILNSSQSLDSKKSTKPNESPQKAPIKNGNDSDSRDSLILPFKPSSSFRQILPTENLSDSEPEDPEEVKIHQKRLDARKSRINSNLSTISNVNKLFPLNRTLNLTTIASKSKFIPARLSEPPPDLLNLSSEEDEPNARLKFTIKESDSEDVVDNKESKQKPEESQSTLLLQEQNLEVPSLSAVAEELPENTPKISNRVPSHEDEQEIPLTASLVNKTVSPKFTLASSSRQSQSKRVSTPQAKNLCPSKLLAVRLSKRISRASETIVIQQGSPVLEQKDSIRGTSRIAAKSPKTSIMSPVRELRMSQDSASKSKDGSISPSFESEVINKSYALNGSETAIDSSPAKSPAVLKTQKPPSKKKLKKSVVRESLKNKTKDLTVISASIEASSAKARRVLRSSKMFVSTPQKLIFSESPARSTPPSESSSAVVLTNMISGISQLTGIRPVLKQPTPGADMVKFVEPRFMASSRPANEGDPIQYSVSYESPTLFVIYWKLKPETINYCRTRGETCIQVMEGEVLIKDQVYPRGNLIKIPGSSTYSVTNHSSDSDTLYLVTEYL